MELSIHELKQLLRLMNTPGIETVDLEAMVKELSDDDEGSLDDYSDDELDDAVAYRQRQIAETRKEFKVVS